MRADLVARDVERTHTPRVVLPSVDNRPIDALGQDDIAHDCEVHGLDIEQSSSP